MDREKKTEGFFSFYRKDFILLPMTKVLPSTFQYFDAHYSVIDDRHHSIALLRFCSVPCTILADIIVGIAHLIFLGLKRELNEDLFWEVAHQQLFEYPFQQLIYLLFSSLGTAIYQDYGRGYEIGQWGVQNFSHEAYRGRPVIFKHVISTYEGPQYFPGVTLNEQDRRNIDRLVEYTIRFQYDQKQLENESPLASASPLVSLLKTINEETLSGCHEKEAIQKAKEARDAFLSLPLALRVFLLRPTC